jgi:23S rRNA (guanosine2251-2'-O)-methyltransferase
VAQVSNTANLLIELKKNNFWVYGADPHGGKELMEESFPQKVVLVIGNEERGLRRLVRERCDLLLSIPMRGVQVGSLNASVSGGIFLYEIIRQRRMNS